MCLAVPGKIKEIYSDKTALVDFIGVDKKVAVDLIKDLAAGDYIIVHAGFAISKVDMEEAIETLKYFDKL